MLPQVRVLLPKDMGARTWGDELLVAEGNGYIGKVLFMRAGEAGGLQSHVEKDETSFLFSGEAWVYTDTGNGELTRYKMLAGTSIHIPPGAVHKVEAVTNCVFFEASNPVFNDRIRLEERYGLESGGGLPSTRDLKHQPKGTHKHNFSTLDMLNREYSCSGCDAVVSERELHDMPREWLR